MLLCSHNNNNKDHIMDHFDKFYLEITKLNYHFKMNKELTGRYQKVWKIWVLLLEEEP